METYFDLGKGQVNCLQRGLPEVLGLVGNYVWCLVINVKFVGLRERKRWGKILKSS